MSISNNRRIFDIPENTYCFNIEETEPVGSNNKMKMIVPILMSNISMGNKPLSLPEHFSGDSIFSNDQSCKPSCDKMFTYSNYIKIPLKYNSPEWSHLLNEDDLVDENTRFLCEFKDENIDRIYFSTDIE